MLKSLFINICKVLAEKNSYAQNSYTAAMLVTVFIELLIITSYFLYLIYAEDTIFDDKYGGFIMLINFVVISVIYFFMVKKFKSYAKDLEGSKELK